MIEAAGGVVWRRNGKGAVKVLLVHRPRYDDWSLPKGKLEAGEGAKAAALREVAEETGLSCEAGPELITVHYEDNKGRPKRVRYWAMRVVDGEFAPNDEVDEVQWYLADRVSEVLTYAHDVPVVDALRDLLVAAG
jgi:8-oxo-dGTP diphosphatase